MRQFGLSALDAFLLCLAALIALMLRENFKLTENQLTDLFPYIAVTGIASIILVPISGLNGAIWCFSDQYDFLRVTGVVIGACLGTVALCFMYNRLEGVPRSLPFLQAFVGITLLEMVRGVNIVSLSWRLMIPE